MNMPKRWRNYTRFGRIADTQFIASKTPLDKVYNNLLLPTETYYLQDLLDKHPNVGLIIDLNISGCYYDVTQECRERGIKYRKIPLKRSIPTDKEFERFKDIVNEFLLGSSNGKLICVHCVHGINRTGYCISRYMMECMRYTAEDSIKKFETDRGHRIERAAYVQHLKSLDKTLRPSY